MANIAEKWLFLQDLFPKQNNDMAYKENYPSKLLEDAVDAISSLPGVGRRSALRLALHLLRQPQENVHHFTSAINALRDDVRYCRECMMISDGDVCSICSDRSRDRKTICVVETVRDVMSIENTGQYHGVYHVLGGIISPINGIGPSDIAIKQLVDRIASLSAGGDGAEVEVILALSGDVEGESMRKAFLKAPLKFSRISSGFSYARKHPVTRKVQPHTGIDYAAPKGTPVMSIGDGVVTSKKYEGAGGNTVRIRHNSVYSTAYLHLSGYAKGLKVGQRVRQGEVIGYVGSTGRSTGPHLDFRVWKNGSPINPLKMESPPTDPLKKENMDQFSQVYENYKARIDTIQARSVAAELFRLL